MLDRTYYQNIKNAEVQQCNNAKIKTTFHLWLKEVIRGKGQHEFAKPASTWWTIRTNTCKYLNSRVPVIRAWILVRFWVWVSAATSILTSTWLLPAHMYIWRYMHLSALSCDINCLYLLVFTLILRFEAIIRKSKHRQTTTAQAPRAATWTFSL